jgi:hypothetical protein
MAAPLGMTQLATSIRMLHIHVGCVRTCSANGMERITEASSASRAFSSPSSASKSCWYPPAAKNCHVRCAVVPLPLLKRARSVWRPVSTCMSKGAGAMGRKVKQLGHREDILSTTERNAAACTDASQVGTTLPEVGTQFHLTTDIRHFIPGRGGYQGRTQWAADACGIRVTSQQGTAES